MCRLPLVVRFVAGSFLLGLVIWLALDAYQGRELHRLVEQEFSQRLQEHARSDRLRFDETVRSHSNLVRILAATAAAQSHLHARRDGDATWTDADAKVPDVTVVDSLPRWLPPRAVMRQFPEPGFLLVMDAHDRVRSVYRTRSLAIPGLLVERGRGRLLKMTERQPLLTEIYGVPYLLSSDVVSDAQGGRLGRIMAASPIDDRFLLQAQGLYFDDEHIVALIHGEPPVVMASSDQERLPTRHTLSAVEREFLTVDKAFFDYGAAEVKLSFATLVPRSELLRLMNPVIDIERGQRTVLAVALIGFFLFVLLLLSNRIRALNDRIGHFTRQTFGVDPAEVAGGDELRGLEQQFQRLSDEVVASRQALQDEAREKLHLLRERMQVRAENERLQTLQTVTDFLGVGVLRMGDDGPVAENAAMAEFADECGGLQPFLRVRMGGDCAIRDLAGSERLFEIARPAGLEADLLLVQDVTERRRAEAAMHEANETLERLVAERTEALRRKVAALLVAEDDLRRTKEQAERASQVKTEFLSVMGHELRTPLNAIIGFADLMGSEVLGALGHQSYRGYIKDILASARHLLDVINDILDITKLEAGSLKLRVERLDIETVVQDAIDLVARHADESGLALASAGDEDLAALRGDRGQVLHLRPGVGCRSTLFASEAQSALAVLAPLRAAGVSRFRIELLDEDRAATAALLSAYAALLCGKVDSSASQAKIAAASPVEVSKGTWKME